MDIIEQQVREFAERFPTPNVQRMLTLCESGAITWMQAHDLAKRALLRGMS